MFDELEEALRQLLIQEIPITDGEIEIAFDQPKREWSARLSRPTINLFLYDVRENVMLRNYGFPVSDNEGGEANTVLRKRTPLRMDCNFMVTTWATEPADEHRLLADTMLALARYPTLPERLLEGRLAEQPYELRTLLGAHDRLTNVAEIWSSLDNEIRPSVSYQVVVTMDPWRPVVEPTVREMQLRTNGMAPDADGNSTNAETGYTVAGTLRDSRRDGAPVAGARVAIIGTGRYLITGETGRFTFRLSKPGSFRLTAQHPDGTSTERRLSLPNPAGEFDLVL